jgi:hypothetical protein
MKKIFKGVALLLACCCVATALPACGSGEDTHKHTYYKFNTIDPDCENDGLDYYVCPECLDVKVETIPALGHEWAESSLSIRYLIPCTREGCNGGKMQDGNHTYDEDMAYTFTAEDDEKISALYDQILSAITAVGEYNDQQYEEGSDIYNQYVAFCELFVEYAGWMKTVYEQMENAEVQYYVDIESETVQSNYLYITSYRSAMVKKYYDIYTHIKESAFKNYFFYGWSEESINSYLENYNSSSDELVALKSANNEIEVEYCAIDDPETSDRVPELYAQYAENNKRIAELCGYDNYLEYASKNIYGRSDYSAETVDKVYTYLKTYIKPLLSTVRLKYLTSATTEIANNIDYFNTEDFFSNVEVNGYVNNFLDEMSKYSTINFSQNLEDVLSDSLILRGTYETGFTMGMPSINRPIIYMGVARASTLVHEYGHYINYVYDYSVGLGDYDQSFDLDETHSQGLMALYVYYMQNELSAEQYIAQRYYTLATYLRNILAYMAVYKLEDAIYSNSYDGLGSDEIMADGQITSDEYDTIYYNLLTELGVEKYFNNYYWRYCLDYPAYFLSYSLSLINVVQLFVKAETDGFESAVESYTKLITYVDVDSSYTYSQVLEYAGLCDYTDEALYQKLSSALG